MVLPDIKFKICGAVLKLIHKLRNLFSLLNKCSQRNASVQFSLEFIAYCVLLIVKVELKLIFCKIKNSLFPPPANGPHYLMINFLTRV
jgi:hypothetical protein